MNTPLRPQAFAPTVYGVVNLLLGLFLLALWGYIFLYQDIAPQHQLPCLFQHYAGVPCPGCGLLRSLHAFAHNYWNQVSQWHPMGWPMGIFLFGQLVFRIIFSLGLLWRPEAFHRLWRIDALQALVAFSFLAVAWVHEFQQEGFPAAC